MNNTNTKAKIEQIEFLSDEDEGGLSMDYFDLDQGMLSLSFQLYIQVTFI